jgi:hypothetical protein
MTKRSVILLWLVPGVSTLVLAFGGTLFVIDHGGNPVAQKGIKGDQGPAGPEGPPGPAGPAGRSTSIRFVNGECRQVCMVACEDNERILETIAINPGGTFTFDADNKATFRPEQQDTPVKVILACCPYRKSKTADRERESADTRSR